MLAVEDRDSDSGLLERFGKPCRVVRRATYIGWIRAGDEDYLQAGDPWSVGWKITGRALSLLARLRRLHIWNMPRMQRI